MTIPVYLFTGFLEGGKTSIIQESLNDQNFNSGEKTLVLMCEEGMEELTPDEFWGKNVKIQYIEDVSWLTRENLEGLSKNHKIDRIIIEYNGMWQLQTLYEQMPANWSIYQNIMFADANTFIIYNNNMRQLTVDKILDAEMVVLNRTPDDMNKDEIHKIIRGISRRAAIVYDYPDGHVEYDQIEDPLPFDIDAPVIEIKDEDYAIWYRDMTEELGKYKNKTIKVKGIVATDPRLPSNSVILGRHVMTCCADDIQYSGLVCVFKQTTKLKTRDWITVKGTLKIEQSKLYRQPGPVIYVESTEFAVPPKQELATFY
ncbi:MAG: TIGR03943 family protein [Clostridia bacterium]|nr:TIGR03943 family protein [Clostridia bacterium]